MLQTFDVNTSASTSTDPLGILPFFWIWIGWGSQGPRAFGRVLDVGACLVPQCVRGGLTAGQHAARAARLVGWLQMPGLLCLMQGWKMLPMKA